ncbi:hypothetical protein E4M00_12955 [Leifsonia flava]|uniref:Glycosyltransferase family 1 protein n=2 Tax=Orlajensenia leifsoniae TaxID=2561933 RepID=A0A4Y9QY13_9MICO|nr:hypothetical protein E4M00_12955 [Leifsonia flava]
MRDPRWEVPAPLRRRIKNLAKLKLLERASRKRNVTVVWLREPAFASSGTELFAVDPFIADATFAELVADSQRLKKKLDLRPDRLWLCITGAITDRKNVPLVLEALRILAERVGRDQFGLLLFGPVRTTASDKAGWIAYADTHNLLIRIEDSLISNREMNAVMLASDISVMAYSTHSPNSTLGKAFALGVRIAVAGPPSVVGFAAKVGNGATSTLDARGLAEAILATVKFTPEVRFDAVSEAKFARSVLGIE